MERRQFGLAHLFWLVFVTSIFSASWYYLPIKNAFDHFWWSLAIVFTATALIRMIRHSMRFLPPRRWSWFGVVTCIAWSAVVGFALAAWSHVDYCWVEGFRGTELLFELVWVREIDSRPYALCIRGDDECDRYTGFVVLILMAWLVLCFARWCISKAAETNDRLEQAYNRSIGQSQIERSDGGCAKSEQSNRLQFRDQDLLLSVSLISIGIGFALFVQRTGIPTAATPLILISAGVGAIKGQAFRGAIYGIILSALLYVPNLQ